MVHNLSPQAASLQSIRVAVSLHIHDSDHIVHVHTATILLSLAKQILFTLI